MTKKVAGRTNLATKKVEGVPGFLVDFIREDTSLANLDQYVIIPVVKMVQGSAGLELKKKFGEGTAILRPGDIVLAKYEDDNGQATFDFVPHFFFTEFTKDSALGDSENPWILQRSFDQTSEIAKKARDADQRKELYPGHEDRKPEDKKYFRYVEHLCFAGVIYGEHQLEGTQVVLSFEKGEFWQGRNFISAIKMRKSKVEEQRITLPLWSQVWTFSVGFRDKGANKKWYGMDFEIADEPLIKEDEADAMFAAHTELKEVFTKDLLQVDHGERDEEVPSEDM